MYDNPFLDLNEVEVKFEGSPS